MKFSEIINISDNFKSSINLKYDLLNEEKIKYYVPTSNICDVLETYIDIILGNQNKSLYLEGPYGRGKSYLLLVLSYIFSKKNDSEIFESFLNKIKLLNTNLAKKIEEINAQKLFLLPVIITNNKSNIEDAFTSALNESLINFNIKDIELDSNYKSALRLLNNWFKNENEALNKTLCALNIDYEALIDSLKKYNNDSYNKFLNIYEKMTRGIKYENINSKNIIEIYDEVSKKIVNYDYVGLNVIFDEFGVFLENKDRKFIKNLNFIQNFAEKANSSDKEKIVFSLISHKNVSLYQNDEYKDDFVKIKGRFKELKFDRELNENYELIAFELTKLNNYDKYLKEFLITEKDSILNGKSTNVLDNDTYDFLINNAYPFNPISLYVLVNISEKLAQNERTLFSFLNDEAKYTFKDFINNDNYLLNVDYIYDYFEENIKNSEYRNIYSKVNYLSKKVDEDELKVIKVIALIKIINDDIKFSATKEVIDACLFKDTSNELSSLEQRNLIMVDFNKLTYNFHILTNNYIFDMIKKTIDLNIKNFSLESLLNQYFTEYYYSKEYNFEFKMTRFIKNIFVSAENINNINFDYSDCDGYLLTIIDNKLKISDYMAFLGDNVVITRIYKEKFSKDFIKNLEYVAAIDILLKDNKNSLEVIEELSILKEDVYKKLSLYLDNINKCAYIDFEKISLNKKIYQVFKQTYNKTFILNNEMINKEHITHTAKKALLNVIDNLVLTKKDLYTKTSQEMTIYNSYYFNDNSSIIEEVYDYFITQPMNTSFLYIVNKLSSRPYKIRKPIIVLLLSDVFSKINSEMNNQFIIYNNDKEVTINSDTLYNVVYYPSSYKFNLLLLDDDKYYMINSLCDFLKIDYKDNNISEIYHNLKSKILSYPQVILQSNSNDNILRLTNKALVLKDLFLKETYNYNDFMFNFLLEKLNTNYLNVTEDIKIILSEYDEKYNDFTEKMINHVITSFNEEKTIRDSFINYKLANNIDIETKFDNLSYNNQIAINYVVHTLIHANIGQLNKAKLDKFYDELAKFKNKLTIKIEKITKKEIKLSALSLTLYSNLKESLDEYGDSIGLDEKINILEKLIEEVVNNDLSR